MNIKVKTTLIIIITLLIGILIGALLNRVLLQHRIKRAFLMQTPGFFITLYEDIIEPDSEQSKLIREILDKHVKRMSEIRKNFRKDLQSELESLRKELDPTLTPEQKKRLQNRLPLPFRRFRRFPDHRGPFWEERKQEPSKEEKK